MNCRAIFPRPRAGSARRRDIGLKLDEHVGETVTVPARHLPAHLNLDHGQTVQNMTDIPVRRIAVTVVLSECGQAACAVRRLSEATCLQVRGGVSLTDLAPGVVAEEEVPLLILVVPDLVPNGTAVMRKVV